jgi:hypothetical protein
MGSDLPVLPRLRSQLATLMSGDVHVTAQAVARLVLDELDRQHDIVRVLEQDGDRPPSCARPSAVSCPNPLTPRWPMSCSTVRRLRATLSHRPTSQPWPCTYSAA